MATVGFVPQEPADLLCAETVADECVAADRDTDAPPGTTAALLQRLAPDISPSTPRDLSEGQRLCLVLAMVLASSPPMLLLDEPTRGLDYGSKRRLIEILRSCASGRTAVLISHA